MVVIVVIQSFYFICQQIEQVVAAKVSKHAKRASKQGKSKSFHNEDSFDNFAHFCATKVQKRFHIHKYLTIFSDLFAYMQKKAYLCALFCLNRR